MRRAAVVPALVMSVLVVSCGGSDDGGAPTTGTSPPTAPPTAPGTDTTTNTAPSTTAVETTTTAPSTTAVETTTTLDPISIVAPYAKPGPHPVGVTTLELPSGSEVEVWYPAADGTTGEVTYDARDFVPEAVLALLTADVSASYSFPGARDASIADGGPYPVVLFSHGFSGFRLQSSFLTSHLASHGMIVAAPDHVSRDLRAVLGGTTGDREGAVADLVATLELLLDANDDDANRFAGLIDADRVAAVGHSAGGGTVFAAASDDRIDGYVSLAAGGGADADAIPAVPSFFVAGALDAVVPPDTRTRPAFEAASSPSWYWELDGVGHNGFTDFCTFGNGRGVIGVAEASGLGDLLDALPQLRALGEDGCVPPAVAVEDIFPIVRHGVTSWLRWLFGDGYDPIGLGPEINEVSPVDVVTDSR